MSLSPPFRTNLFDGKFTYGLQRDQTRGPPPPPNDTEARGNANQIRDIILDIFDLDYIILDIFDLD